MGEMEFSAEIWAAIVAAGSAISGVAVYLIKPGMDASRRRADEDAAAIKSQALADAKHRDERAELEKEYLRQSITNSKTTTETNAKQASDLAMQAASLGVMAAAISTVSDTTKTVQSALKEFAGFGQILIKQLPSVEDQNMAQRYLNECVTILGHKQH